MYENEKITTAAKAQAMNEIIFNLWDSCVDEMLGTKEFDELDTVYDLWYIIAHKARREVLEDLGQPDNSLMHAALEKVLAVDAKAYRSV